MELLCADWASFGRNRDLRIILAGRRLLFARSVMGGLGEYGEQSSTNAIDSEATSSASVASGG